MSQSTDAATDEVMTVMRHKLPRAVVHAGTSIIPTTEITGETLMDNMEPSGLRKRSRQSPNCFHAIEKGELPSDCAVCLESSEIGTSQIKVGRLVPTIQSSDVQQISRLRVSRNAQKACSRSIDCRAIPGSNPSG
jgi:hypothetical protein